MYPLFAFEKNDSRLSKLPLSLPGLIQAPICVYPKISPPIDTHHSLVPYLSTFPPNRGCATIPARTHSPPFVSALISGTSKFDSRGKTKVVYSRRALKTNRSSERPPATRLVPPNFGRDYAAVRRLIGYRVMPISVEFDTSGGLLILIKARILRDFPAAASDCCRILSITNKESGFRLSVLNSFFHCIYRVLSWL